MASKLQFAAKSQKSPSGWGLFPQALSVVHLSSIGLFSSGPKLENFCAKKPKLLVQASYQQNSGCASGRIRLMQTDFQAIIWAANENSQ